MNDFISIDENIEFPHNIHLYELKANKVSVGGEIKGRPSLVNGFLLQNLADLHLSKNNPQNNSNAVFIPTVVIRGGFDADVINGYDFKGIVDILRNSKTNEQMLSASNIAVDQMFVNGSVYFAEVNGHDLEKIKAAAIRLDQPNIIDLPITFLDPITVNGNLNVDQLNDEHFDTFVNDVVKKSSNSSRVYGTTIFKEDVIILNNAEISTINKVQVDRILTKNCNRKIVNPIRIVGDVSMSNLIVDGKLNGISAEELNTCAYDYNTKSYFLQKNVFFNQSIDVKYIELHGGYNDIGNVNEYLEEIVRTDRHVHITGTKAFTGFVYFGSGIHVDEYNGVDVPKFLSNVILIDQIEPVDIYSDVVFEAPVQINHMRITGDLSTAIINNCSVTDWIQKTIRTDRPFNFDGAVIFPEGTFQATNIDTNYLNEYTMNEVLTLNTPQNFSGQVHFDDVYSTIPINTNGRVSGYDLPMERTNTLMVSIFLHLQKSKINLSLGSYAQNIFFSKPQVYGVQSIDIPTVFPSVRVLKSLTINGLVNERNLR